MQEKVERVVVIAIVAAAMAAPGFAQTGKAGKTGSATVGAASAGWKVVKDREGICQFSVPEDWKQAMPGSTMFGAPDGKATAVLHPARQAFEALKGTVTQTLKPEKTLENSSRRFWYTYQFGQAGGLNYYVATPNGSRACAAQVGATKDITTFEPTMKKIVESVGPAK